MNTATAQTRKKMKITNALQRKLNPLANLERKARHATKTWPESRRIIRETETVGRKLASGKFSSGQARVLKTLLRQRKQCLLLKWMYAHMRGEAPVAY